MDIALDGGSNVGTDVDPIQVIGDGGGMTIQAPHVGEAAKNLREHSSQVELVVLGAEFPDTTVCMGRFTLDGAMFDKENEFGSGRAAPKERATRQRLTNFPKSTNFTDSMRFHPYF